MTEFEKKMLAEVKGIRKELHEMDKPVKIDGQVDAKIQSMQLMRTC